MFLSLAAWGVLSAANALVGGPMIFYALRFLLGLAEAGFFPATIFYLTLWFPRTYRASFTAAFIVAQPLSFVIGGPLSAFVLGLNSTYGLHGWQWAVSAGGFTGRHSSFRSDRFSRSRASRGFLV